MAISTELRRAGPYTGDGAQTEFSFGFKVFEASQVSVVTSSEDGLTDVVVDPSSYSVTLNDNQDTSPGGTIRLTTALAAEKNLSILSAVHYVQPMVLTNRGGFYPEVLNDSADRAVILAQQNREILGRALTVPATSSMTPRALLLQIFQAAESAATSAEEAEKYAQICEDIKEYVEVYSWNIPHLVDSIRDVEDYPYDGFFVVGGYGNPGHNGQNISNRYVKAEGSTELRTLGERFADIVNVRDFGAKGDGVTDDTAAIQAAVDCASEKGCRVFIPATGAAYVTSQSVIVKRGVSIFGDSHNGYNGSAASNAEYAKAGTTINPKGTSGSAFVLQENGASISNIQFIHDQPPPTDANWAPTQYPYCIEAQASWHTIRDISVVNGSHGIWLSYTPEKSGGTQVTIDNCRLGALEVGLRHDSLTDTLAVTRVNFAPSWQIDNPTVKAYRHSHTIGWMLGHGSGTYVNGLEFYRVKTAMQLRSLENNVGADTGARCGRFDNILFNLVNQAVVVESSTLLSSINFGTVYAQSYDDWGLSLGDDPLFDFQSNNVNMSFERLHVGICGGSVMRIGAGSGGRVSISDLCVDAYSAASDNQPAFYLDTGAELAIGTYKVNSRSSDSPGKVFTGDGAINVVTGCKRTHVFFPVFNAVSVTCTGDSQYITVDDPFNPAKDGGTQIKLHVNANITTAGTGTLVFSFSGVTAQVDTSTKGWKEADTNWVDIPSSFKRTEAGRLNVTGPNGVKFNTGSCYVQWR